MAGPGSWTNFKKPAVKPPAAKYPAVNRNSAQRLAVYEVPACTKLSRQLALLPGRVKEQHANQEILRQCGNVFLSLANRGAASKRVLRSRAVNL
ncbi:hypothetical protein PAL_GLEAN10018521 [Pteropus alecto]|uniref:Uncharacterized protein n=1 Tax=Pteropus alecto TaxID=9402 RepID=L5KWW2_PTEAL|nr:hypothetical protein PAL_GLEAN10018521 [Pteropus alecto]